MQKEGRATRRGKEGESFVSPVVQRREGASGYRLVER